VAVRGIDVARPLREPDLGRILLALGKHGVLPLSLVGYKVSALTYASTHDLLLVASCVCPLDPAQRVDMACVHRDHAAFAAAPLWPPAMLARTTVLTVPHCRYRHGLHP